jgi:hypothetical protein
VSSLRKGLRAAVRRYRSASAPDRSWAAVGLRELDERLDGRCQRVEIDDLQDVRGPGQRERTIDLRGSANENQPACGLPGADVAVKDQVHTAGVGERELAKV